MAAETDQTQLDSFEPPIAIPSHKLDADQYSAEDIDGGTESLVGSGNMAYASLQASQSDEIINTNQQSSITDDSTAGLNSNVNPANTRISTEKETPLSGETTTLNNAQGNDDLTANSDGGVGAQNQVGTSNEGAGNFSANTVSSVSASELSSNQGAFAPSGSGLSLQEGIDGANGSNGETPDIPTPTNGTDGNDGTIGDTNIEINLGDVTIDLGDITELLDQTFINLGDVISTLSTTVTEITELLGDVINNVDISNLLDLTQVNTLVNNLTTNLTENVSNTLIEITNITNNVTNFLENVLGGDGDLELNLDLNVLDTGILGLNIPLSNFQNTDINLDIDLSPTINLANNIADLTGLDVLSDTLAELGSVVNTLQDTIDQTTDLVSDLDLSNPGATVDQLVETLENLGQTVTAITDSIDDSIGGILDNIGIGDGTLDNTIDTTLNNIGDGLDDLTDGATEELTDALEGVVDEITDAVDTLTDGSLSDIGGGDDEGLISQTVDPVVEDVTNIVDDLTGGATEELTDAVNDVVDGVSDLTDNLTGGLSGGLFGQNNDNNNGTDTDIAVDLGIGAEGNDAIGETIEAAIDPVEDLIGDIDLSIDTTILGDGETDNNNGDSDLNVNIGIDLVDNTILNEGLDVPLDPIEDLVGDIDIDINLGTDLLGAQADPLIDNADGGTGEDTALSNIGDEIGGAVGDILGGGGDEPLESLLDEIDDIADGLGLGAIGGGDDEGLISQTVDPVVEDVTNIVDDLTGGATEELTDAVNDVVDGVSDFADNLTGGLLAGMSDQNNDDGADAITDILGHTADDILDGSLDDIDLGATFEPVEDIIGDMDIGGAIDLLNFDNTENGSESTSDSDETSWTESLITDGGGLFGDIMSGMDGLGDLLPDPAGTIAEGIGVLDVDPDINIGSIGGLFG